MEAKSERKEGVLVFFINGRLDAFGAQQLDEWIKGALHDDDKELVLDLTGCTYLSSGGLRTFNILKKEMKRRNGRFALAAVGEYPKKVLDMAGFSTIFDIFPTTGDAIEDMRKKRKDPTLFNEIFYKKIEAEGVSLTIEPGWMTAPPVLRVTGDINKLLHARLSEDDIKTRKFSEITYSLGLGALGADKKEAMALLGEMITLYGSMVWLPTDGNNTPDFMTPLDADADVPVYTGFNVTLDGPFNEYLTLDTQKPEGVAVADIYRMILTGAADRVRSYKGIVACDHLGRDLRPCQFRDQEGTGCRFGPARRGVHHGPGPVRDLDGLGYRHGLQRRHPRQFWLWDRPCQSCFRVSRRTHRRPLLGKRRVQKSDLAPQPRRGLPGHPL